MFLVKLFLLAFFASLVTAQYRIKPRIVQGSDAVRGQFPFYVYLQIFVKEGIADCGGSLISDEWVLTAAHCLKNAMQAILHLGSLKAADWSDDFDDRKIFLISPENMHIYPRFSQLFFVWNDIGLIRLPEPVTFSEVIKPIPFTCSKLTDTGVDVIAMGNGMTKNNDTALPKILQYIELKTISQASCLKSFPFLIFRKSVICVKGEEKRSACHGDSGGPLITSDNSLIGVVSFGSRLGCEDGAPQVFTRIAKYAKWIKDVSGVECKN